MSPLPWLALAWLVAARAQQCGPGQWRCAESGQAVLLLIYNNNILLYYINISQRTDAPLSASRCPRGAAAAACRGWRARATPGAGSPSSAYPRYWCDYYYYHYYYYHHHHHYDDAGCQVRSDVGGGLREVVLLLLAGERLSAQVPALQR